MIEEIQALWQQGFSFQEIGDKLGTTRGVISGKIHRAKLAGVQFTPRAIVPKKKSIGVREGIKVNLKPTQITSLKREQCRFILNEDAKNPIFCEGVIHYRSYCEDHAKLCYVVTGGKKK